MPGLTLLGPTSFHLAAARKAETLALLHLYYDRNVLVATREDTDQAEAARRNWTRARNGMGTHGTTLCALRVVVH